LLLLLHLQRAGDEYLQHPDRTWHIWSSQKYEFEIIIIIITTTTTIGDFMLF